MSEILSRRGSRPLSAQYAEPPRISRPSTFMESVKRSWEYGWYFGNSAAPLVADHLGLLEDFASGQEAFFNNEGVDPSIREPEGILETLKDLTGSLVGGLVPMATDPASVATALGFATKAKAFKLLPKAGRKALMRGILTYIAQATQDPDETTESVIGRTILSYASAISPPVTASNRFGELLSSGLTVASVNKQTQLAQKTVAKKKGLIVAPDPEPLHDVFLGSGFYGVAYGTHKFYTLKKAPKFGEKKKKTKKTNSSRKKNSKKHDKTT